MRLTHTLDTTCAAPVHQCSALMSYLAQEIQQADTCGADLSLGNPVVTQAYNGFIAYEPLYHAGCLTDVAGNYCFATAVTNASAAANSYIYYLPLGVALPGGTQPTCNSCLKKTMSIFAAYASNSSQPLNADFGSAADQLDIACGPHFAGEVVPATSAASAKMSVPNVGSFGFMVVGGLAMFFLL